MVLRVIVNSESILLKVEEPDAKESSRLVMSIPAGERVYQGHRTWKIKRGHDYGIPAIKSALEDYHQQSSFFGNAK